MRITRNQNGFTLMEILVVVAITMILFGLLFWPMTKTFTLTRQARAMTEAQDAARLNLEKISRDVTEALYVYDNSIPILVPGPGQTTPTANVEVPFAKIDLVLPRMLMHCNDPNHPVDQPRDYERDDPSWPDEEAWPPCPFDGSILVEARPIQPAQPSKRIVRYFIGLKDPSKPYSNGYLDPLAQAIDADNMYVLYRAEFNPWDSTLLPVNAAGRPDLDKPDFFYDRAYSANWKRISRIVGPARENDMIAFTTTGTAVSAVRFTPSAVQNDALAPTFINDTDSEVPIAIPTVFRGANGLWTPSYKVVVYRDNFTTTFYTAPDLTTGHMCVWKYGSNTAVFDITQYQANGAMIPNDPAQRELMLNVDPKLGEVRFSFDAPPEEFDTAVINNAPMRQCRLTLTTPTDPNYVPNARVVPGSEEVIGPDQTPFGLPRMVRYERVARSLEIPGLNQYLIDYDTGELWFVRSVDNPLPAGARVRVNFRYHNNKPGDIVKADYTTKNLLTITYGVGIFVQETGKPQSMELTNKVHVRNTSR